MITGPTGGIVSSIGGWRPGRPCLLFICLAVALATVEHGRAAAAQTMAQVEVFSPQGTVKDVRQVAVRFSQAMTALGDPRLEAPFDIDCPAPGEGRWADGRNWVYDFEANLPAGVDCLFALKEGVRTYGGTPLGGQRVFRFDTGGPAIRASLPREGERAIDENQIFILALDAAATMDSVRERAYCAVEGLAERIPVRVLEGTERDAALSQRRALGYVYYWILWKSGTRSLQRMDDRSLESSERALTVLSCGRTLPPGTQVRLVWGAGIAASSGVATKTDQALAFRTRPAFTARLECRRADVRAGCLPIEPVRVVFSAPVARERAFEARVHGPGGTVIAPFAEGIGETPTVEAIRFPASYTGNGDFELHLPAELQDDAGRFLENAASFPLAFSTDAFPPLAKFATDFGILEAREGGILPVSLRNLATEDRPDTVPGRKLRIESTPSAIAGWLRRRSDLSTKDSIFTEGDATEAFDLPVAADGKATELVGIPLGQPGVYMVEIASPRLGAALEGTPSVFHARSAALVTDMAVHFKWGRERSLVWVTRLDTGQPVAGANLALTDMCSGTELWSGLSGADGTAFIEGDVLDTPGGYGSCRYSYRSIYMASARLNDDIAFTLSTWNDGIAPHDFALPAGSSYASEVVHTVFDRPLYRAGETVSMKHFFRRRTMAGIERGLIEGKIPVAIRHTGSGQTYDFSVTIGPDGTAEQSWRIPDEAKLGDYTVTFVKADMVRHGSGRFAVQHFRVPSMKAVVQGPAGPQARPNDVTFDLHLSYLAGGSASGVPVRLRAASAPLAVHFADHADYRFGGAPVVPGRQSGADRYRNFDAEAAEGGVIRAQTMPLVLDRNGAARVVLPVAALDGPERLTAELDYADANGEILTAAGRVDLWPAALAVGIRREGWVASEKQMRFRVVALDLSGKPISGQKLVARLYAQKTYSYRKRLIGGFYAYESVTEIEPLEALCEGHTDVQGLLPCEVAPGVSGNILVRAETTDAQGNLTGATTSIWVVGDDDWWFGSTAGDRMDLLPEKTDYEAGETARFQVRMPFREATALVTVEREGVLDRFVTTLSGREPVVEVPVRAEHAPNVFVSVLAVRGRVGGFRSWLADRARAHDLGDWISQDGGRPTSLVDLSKPSYRLGNAEIRVGRAPYRLEVRVTPERPVYRIREEARVRLKVARADGTTPPAGAEVALAVVDEGLLELSPNPSWALLDAMMGRRGIEVWTSTAQMQIVGKRHYGRKAVPHGGGGGRERARELFDTLLAWHGRIPLDESGEAEIVVPLNDSLTSFRIVAVAHAGAALFGTGSATIATTQDLMLLSGLPPLVREGDEFAATLTVRNASARDIEAEVTADLAGERLESRHLALEAGEARDVAWRVKVPDDRQVFEWEAAVAETNGDARDRIKVAQTVVPAYPERVYQATIAQLEGLLRLPLERPRGAIPGRGGIAVTLRPRLGDGLDGVRRYMGFYPYICLEQNISKAVALREPAMWAEWMTRLPAFMDGDGLLKYFPVDWLQGEDILTSYVLAIAHEAGWTIPDEVRARLIGALTGFVEGRIVRRSALPTADLAIRKMAAIEALSRYGAARPGMLASIAIEPNLWPTSAVIDWMNLLTRMPAIPERERHLVEAEQILRSRLDFQGTSMGFSTERSDALWWLMVSTDSNALRALATFMDRPAWREDIPRLVRGALGRQIEGHWNTTLANAWGVLAMEKFSAAFEKEPVTGSTRLDYGQAGLQTAWTPESREETAKFPWHEGAADLVIDHHGGGRPWAMVRALAALPLDGALSSGFKIERTLSPVEQQVPGRWSRGDLVRVRLDLEAKSDMTWIVVDDPVPAGATIQGSGLGGQSRLATRGERREGRVWPAFEERRLDAFRAYYRHVPEGRWTVEYTVRLNNPGVFLMPATRAEAMYAPEMFGELPNAPMTVEALP